MHLRFNLRFKIEDFNIRQPTYMLLYKNAISQDLPTIYSSREQEKSFKLNFIKKVPFKVQQQY